MSAALVKQLRERTGAGIMECKRALDEANGNLDKAADLLRTQGMAKAEKKVGRAARQGLIDSYIHAGGRIGSLVELNCETDFVARTPDFKALAHDIAMQVAAMDVRFIHKDEVPADALTAGAEEFGDEKRFLETHVLLHQPFIKEPKRNIDQLVRDAIGKLGENIVVRRAVRFEVGALSGDAAAESESADA
jgi:elongation factor Ts